MVERGVFGCIEPMHHSNPVLFLFCRVRTQIIRMHISIDPVP